MRFYDREKEITYLRSERARQGCGARLTVVSGRRRIGKTQMIHQAMGDEGYLYLLVSRRAEADQCADFAEKAREALGISIYAKSMRFGEFFRVLMEESVRRPITVVIDELQEFLYVEPGVFGEMQAVWDRLHATSQMNLIVCGSVNTLMNRLFFEDGQPLYGRSTAHVKLEPFTLDVLSAILRDHNPNATADDLLALWTFTGGVARYVEELMDRGNVTCEKMIDGVLGEHSFFLDEGRGVLVQEFGKEYGTYFSVMAALARGITTRNEIEQIVGTSVGGHLTKLETSYSLVRKRQPIFETNQNKSCRYQIADNFFSFWFRFVYRNADLIELKRHDVLQSYLRRDYEMFSGFALEGYFREKFIEERRYTRIGSWWDRKGENELDLVCEDALSNRLDIYEVKRDATRVDKGLLETKVEAFLRKNPECRERKITLGILSMADMV